MKRPLPSAEAFSLVEVTLALGIAAFCLLVIVALLPIGLRSNQAAVGQTAANGILSEIVADLRATPATSPPGKATTSQQFSVPLPANPVSASPAPLTLYLSGTRKAAATLETESRYRLTVTFLPNGTSAKTATFVNLQVSWPAGASLANAAGSVKTFVALDRN